jgi:hypothetical protein
MSTNLLQHAVGIQRQQFAQPGLRKPEGPHYRTLRASLAPPPPVGSRETWIRLSLSKVDCQKSFFTRSVRVSFATCHGQHKWAFECCVPESLRYITLDDALRYLGISWGLAKAIHKWLRRKKYGKPRPRYLQQLADNDVCVRIRRSSLTLVLDLTSGAVLFVGKGRGSYTLRRFFRRLRPSQGRCGRAFRALRVDCSSPVRVSTQFHQNSTSRKAATPETSTERNRKPYELIKSCARYRRQHN